MHTITLPDHISFEELAQKWCSYAYDIGSQNALSYDSGKWEFLDFSRDESYLHSKITFTFDPNSRELTKGKYGDCDIIKYLLDFIKERSNG